MNELKKHVFANTVDRVMLKKLVRKLFPKCRCREIHERVKEFSQVKNCSKFKLFSLRHYPPAMSVTINKDVNLSQIVLTEKPAARNIIKILLSKKETNLVVILRVLV